MINAPLNFLAACAAVNQVKEHRARLRNFLAACAAVNVCVSNWQRTDHFLAACAAVNRSEKDC